MKKTVFFLLTFFLIISVLPLTFYAEETDVDVKIDILFQIAAVGVIVAVLNQLLTKSERSEQALMVTIVGLVIVLLVVVGEIKTLFDTIKQVFSFV